MKTIFFFLCILVSANSFAFYKLDVPFIYFSFKTKDGAPVKGVTFAYIHTYQNVSMSDGTGWIPLPSLPHYKTFSEAAVLFGNTDAKGELTFMHKIFSSANPFTKEPKVNFFSNGILDICAKKSIRMPMDQHCGVEVAESQEKGIFVNCETTLNSAELEREIETAKAECAAQ